MALAGASIVVSTLLLVACGGPGHSTATTQARSDTPPFDVSTIAGAASRGDDLVVVQERTNRVAIRWADGSWSEAPAIDAEGSWFYRTVGPTVVAGGFECDSLDDAGGCAGAEPSFYRFAEDGWQKLDAPDPTQPLRAEVELTAEQRLRDWGLFKVGGADTYLVDARGDVTLFDHGYICAVDDSVVSAAAPGESHGPPPPERFFNAFEIRSLSRPADPPAIVAAPEPIPMLGEQICGAGHVSTVVPGGTTEWVLDVSDATVSRVESNSNAVGVVGAEGLEAGAATSPDGDTLFRRTGQDGRTMRRTGSGPWNDTGLELSGLWATESGVIGLDAASGTFVEVPAT